MTGDNGNSSGNLRLPPPLTASDQNSFAFPTMKDRVPVIICKVVDLLYRDRINLNLSHPDELKEAIEEMSRLRYELSTNKPIGPIEDTGSDFQVWNDFLQGRLTKENGGAAPTWFGTRWLSAECFVYRRLLQSMRKSRDLHDFDFFGKQKKEAFYGSLRAISSLLSTRDLWSSCNKDLSKVQGLLKISLWANKCDLSISAGASQNFHHDPLAQIEALQSNLLVDDSPQIAHFLKDNMVIDFVMDNAGFEMISDLCLADYLTSCQIAQR